MEGVLANNIFDPTSEALRLSGSPFYLIAHADYMYHLQMTEVLARKGVSKSMYRILTVLRDFEPCRMTDLADFALIKRPTVSRMIDRLVNKQVVKTQQSIADSRAVEIRLSAAGRELLDSLTPLVVPLFVRATQGLSHQEVQRLVATLQFISGNLARRAPK